MYPLRTIAGRFLVLVVLALFPLGSCALALEPHFEGLEEYERTETVLGDLWARGLARQESSWVARVLPAWTARIERVLERRPPTPFTTILVPHFEEFRRTVGGLGGGEVGPDTRGIALPGMRTIVVRTDWIPSDVPSDALSVTLKHELAHLAIHRFPATRVPRWLDEGIASWVSRGSMPARDEAELALLARAGRLYRAATLDQAFPAGHGATTLAYRQSSLMVECLVDKFGRDAIPDLLAALERGATADEAFRGTTGLSLAELEEAFPQWIANRLSLPRLLATLLADPWLIVGLLAVLAAVRMGLGRRRAWRRLSREENEENEEDGAGEGNEEAPAE